MKATILFTCITVFLLSSSYGQSNTEAIFPKGDRAPAANFTGTVWVAPVMANDSTFNLVMGSVTFEAGARSNWHTHPAGQVLVVTEGTGYTQERGKPIQVIHKGDVIKCLPNVEHWHGATPTTSMTHISINPNTEHGVVTWLQKVTDKEYSNIQQ